MSGFTIEIKSEDSTANTIKGVQKNLEDTEKLAHKASESISGIAASFNRAYELEAKARGIREEFAEIVKEATKARSATADLTAALKAEAAVLDRLRGPLDTIQAA